MKELVQEWGPLIGIISTLFVCSAAWRIVGRIEGKMERFASRLDDHSETLREHAKLLLDLRLLPNDFKGFKSALEEFRSDLKEVKTQINLLIGLGGALKDEQRN